MSDSDDQAAKKEQKIKDDQNACYSRMSNTRASTDSNQSIQTTQEILVGDIIIETYNEQNTSNLRHIVPVRVDNKAAERSRLYRERHREEINQRRRGIRQRQKILHQIHLVSNVQNINEIEQITQASSNSQLSSNLHAQRQQRYYERHREEINKRKRNTRLKQNILQSIPATAAERNRNYRKRNRQTNYERKRNSRLRQQNLQRLRTECNINKIDAIEQITEAKPNDQQSLNSSNDDIIQEITQNFTNSPQHFEETQNDKVQTTTAAPHKTEGDEDTNLEGDEETNLEGDEETNLEGDEETNLEGDDDINFEEDEETNLEDDEDINLEDDEETNLEGDEDINLEGEEETNLGGDEETSLEGDEETNLEGDEHMNFEVDEETMTSDMDKWLEKKEVQLYKFSVDQVMDRIAYYTGYSKEKIKLEGDEGGMKSDMDKWSEDDKLIDLVKIYPVIYTKHDNKSSNTEEIRTCWNAIGKELNKDPEICRRRWLDIRLTYLLKRRKNKDTVTNDLQKPSEHNNVYFGDKLNFLDFEIDDDFMPEPSSDDSDVQMVEDCQPKSSSNNTDIQIKKLYEFGDGTTGDIIGGDLKKFSLTDTFSNEHSDSTRIETYNSIPNNNEDTTELFFKKMAKYVGSRFSTEEQAEIKLRICSLLTKAELQFLEKLGK